MVIAAVNCCLLVLVVLELIVTCICVEISMEYHEIQFGELVGRGSFASLHKGVWRGYGGGKLLLLNESKFYLGWTKARLWPTAVRSQHWGICMDSQVLHVLQIGEFVCDIHTNNWTYVTEAPQHCLSLGSYCICRGDCANPEFHIWEQPWYAHLWKSKAVEHSL